MKQSKKTVNFSLSLKSIEQNKIDIINPGEEHVWTRYTYYRILWTLE